MKKTRRVGRPKKRKYTRRKPIELPAQDLPIEVETSAELPAVDIKINPKKVRDYKQMATELWDIIDDVALFTESCYDENKATISPFFRKKFTKRFEYFVRVGNKITSTENALIKR